MSSFRDECINTRNLALCQNPGAKFVFHVTFERWRDMNLELGHLISEENPFQFFDRFCGAEVKISPFTHYGVK